MQEKEKFDWKSLAVALVLGFAVIWFFDPGGNVAMLRSDEALLESPGSAGNIHAEENLRDEVDRYFSSLDLSTVQFNRLETVSFEEPETITVVITPPSGETNSVAFLGRNGVLETHNVPLATQLEAELISLDEGVEVRPQGPIPLLLRPRDSVEHSWRVTARRTEPFILELVLSNRIFIQGREIVDRKPFRRRFEVEVSGWRQALIWIDELDPIWKILGGIASIVALSVAAYSGFNFLRSRTRDPQDNQPPTA